MAARRASRGCTAVRSSLQGLRRCRRGLRGEDGVGSFRSRTLGGVLERRDMIDQELEKSTLTDVTRPAWCSGRAHHEVAHRRCAHEQVGHVACSMAVSKACPPTPRPTCIAVHASKSEHFCSCLCNRACVNVFWRAAGWRLRPHLRIRSRVGARAAAPPLRL